MELRIQLKNSKVMMLQLCIQHLNSASRFKAFPSGNLLIIKYFLFSHLSSLPLRSGSTPLVVKVVSLDWSSNPMEHPGRKHHVRYVTARLGYKFYWHEWGKKWGQDNWKVFDFACSITRKQSFNKCDIQPSSLNKPVNRKFSIWIRNILGNP